MAIIQQLIKKHQVIQRSITGTTVGWLEVVGRIFVRVGHPRGRSPSRWFLIFVMICIYSISFSNLKRNRLCRDGADFAPFKRR